MVVYILATKEAEVGRSQFQASLGKKSDPVSKTSQAWWYMPIIPAT
jgi:hypothetical protein